MDVGNKTHAAILGVFAVAAIGWLATRMIPHHAGTTPDAQPGPSTHATIAPELPQDVTRDAFSHPALYHPDKKAPVAGSSSPGAPLSGSMTSSTTAVDAATADSEIGSDSGSTPLHLAIAPGEIAGKGQQPEKKTPAKLCLKAVIQASKPLAMILVTSDKNAAVQTYSIGEQVRDGYVLTSIGPDSVVLTAKKKRPIRLQVGSEPETK